MAGRKTNEENRDPRGLLLKLEEALRFLANFVQNTVLFKNNGHTRPD